METCILGSGAAVWPVIYKHLPYIAPSPLPCDAGTTMTSLTLGCRETEALTLKSVKLQQDPEPQLVEN